MATKGKNTKKSKNKPSKTRDSKFDWSDSDVVAGKRPARLQLLKLFTNSKKETPIISPLGWFADDSADCALTMVNRWIKVATAPKLNGEKLAAEIIHEVLNLPEDLSENESQLNNATIALGASHLLKVMIGHCEYSDWNGVVEKLLEISRTVESDVGADSAVYQLLGIELPISIAFQIPEIEDYSELGSRTCRKLEVSVTDMLDHDGWPLGCYLEKFGPLVSSWARSNQMLLNLGFEIKSDVAAQLEWLVRQVIRLLRPDRTLMFSVEGSGPFPRSFASTFSALSNDPVDQRLIKFVLGKKSKVKKKKTDTKKSLPRPGNISEWADAALLQSKWGLKSPTVAVDYSQQGCRLEVSSRVSLIQGDCMPMVSANGSLVKPADGFQIVSDLSDEDLEYLELEMDLDSGLCLNRQILLSRTDEFLLIGDSVRASECCDLEYDCRFPLASGIDMMPETETCEVYLTSPNIESLVLPLSLPEWKVARTTHRLTNDQRSLRLVQSTQGKGLYAPMLFDLNPKRSRKKRTWRQLTVAESRVAVSPDEACAFRFQLDKQQWFFYRAISSRGNRTFLGENFNGEFVFNQFEQDGSVRQLIEIDE